jgi:mRNA interferase HigB
MDFWEKRPDAQQPLRGWFKTALAAQWRSLNDVRRIFPHADGIKAEDGDVLTVFNIRGNKYRLVVRIRYDWQLINIRCVLTHPDYDQGKWRQ